MKNITATFIILLFLSFNNVYAEDIPEDMYGKWLRLSEEKDGKNCKKLTVDGKTKCYSIHQSLSEFDDVGPDYVWLNEDENFFEYRIAEADFAETTKPIEYKRKNGKHYFLVDGETIYGRPYETYYQIKQIDNNYIYFITQINPFGEPVELYIREELADKLKIPVITIE